MGVGSRDRNLIVARDGVTGSRISIGVASQQGANVENVIGQVTKSKSATSQHAEELRVLQDDAQRSSLGLEPAIVTVTLDTGEQVVVPLQLLKVLAHVLGRPRAVAGQG